MPVCGLSSFIEDIGGIYRDILMNVLGLLIRLFFIHKKLRPPSLRT